MSASSANIYKKAHTLHVIPTAVGNSCLTLSSLRVPLSNSKLIPRAPSEAPLRTPNVFLNQPGEAPAMQPLMTEIIPKALAAAQGSPAYPRSPNTRDSAVEDPIRVVSAAMSTKPLPTLMVRSANPDPRVVLLADLASVRCKSQKSKRIPKCFRSWKAISRLVRRNLYGILG